VNLILFFNGWGMDENLVAHMPIPDNYQLKVVNFPYEFKIVCEYQKIIPVGFSLGVYYLAKFLNAGKDSFNKVIAINGTPEIIGENGIQKKIFCATSANLSSRSLRQFFDNMQINAPQFPCQTIARLKKELDFLYENYEPQKNVFTHAFISNSDKIIRSTRQIAYFQAKDVAITKIDSGHYPFSAILNWGEIIHEF